MPEAWINFCNLAVPYDKVFQAFRCALNKACAVIFRYILKTNSSQITLVSHLPEMRRFHEHCIVLPTRIAYIQLSLTWNQKNTSQLYLSVKLWLTDSLHVSSFTVFWDGEQWVPATISPNLLVPGICKSCFHEHFRDKHHESLTYI